MKPIWIETELEAVELSLVIWKKLKLTGVTKEKLAVEMPEITLYTAECPMCQFFLTQDESRKPSIKIGIQTLPAGCEGCCLKTKDLCNYNSIDSTYRKWGATQDKRVKMAQANKIYKALRKRQKELQEDA